uniref:Uncharacterized protein ycf20 n=1 Tax=Galdieria sulphuraria TaxID=130081 RepID=A0A075W1R0_GALSU|nr:putative 9.5 kDa allophycocyanin linker protein [Galdieria sulphuraria]AIG92632.1 putative 9.5 kDa allophycocyanin linker protein [Galdieria sulphuraria]
MQLIIVNTLLGIFSSNLLCTIYPQTGDWSLCLTSFIIAFYELIAYISYKRLIKKTHTNIINSVNGFKIGLIYGFYLDAFKLGS